MREDLANWTYLMDAPAINSGLDLGSDAGDLRLSRKMVEEGRFSRVRPRLVKVLTPHGRLWG